MTSKHALFVLTAVIGSGIAGLAAEEVKLKDRKGKVRVEIGGKHFTDYVYEGRTKPLFYPVINSDGTRMTRDHPFKETPGEAKDHPHHESVWYTHGDVDGVSYWHHGEKCGTIHQTALKASGNGITTVNEWRKPDGSVQLTDHRYIEFGTIKGARVITFTITLKATHGDVTFGDTKEGSMGIRTHPSLRLTNGKGVTTANGQARNSAGGTGKDIWGKKAAWVAYWGKVDDKPVGVAIFDRPTNPRHPTTWHARDYGLVAANPFGLRHFQGKKNGEGKMTIKKGNFVTFTYGIVFYEGNADQVPAIWEEWSK